MTLCSDNASGTLRGKRHNTSQELMQNNYFQIYVFKNLFIVSLRNTRSETPEILINKENSIKIQWDRYNKLKDALPNDVLFMLYNTLVLPYINYYRMGRRISAIWLVNYCVRIFHWLARDIMIAIAIAKTISTISKRRRRRSLRQLANANPRFGFIFNKFIEIVCSQYLHFPTWTTCRADTCQFGKICDCESVRMNSPVARSPRTAGCSAVGCSRRWARRALQYMYM